MLLIITFNKTTSNRIQTKIENMLNFTKKLSSKNSNLVIFVDEKGNFNDTKNKIQISVKSKIQLFLKQKKKNNEDSEIISFDIDQLSKCLLVKVTKKKEKNYPEELGSNLYNNIKINKLNTLEIYADSLKLDNNQLVNFISRFIHGFNLKSYSFDKYKTSKKNFSKFNKIICVSEHIEKFKKNINYYQAVEAGVFFARDLVSEPPNVLTPKKYVEEIKKLKKIGLKINIYDERKLKSMGMNALLGVGQGSINQSFLVTISWNGKKSSKKSPLAFGGKGVCFDTGGISLKPARFMEEMKYDMAGSAVVVGLMKTLALRKAKVNAVGVVGVVEKMPGGNAQRPGDIVKSYSGKTIEILNTDAEGRLVLADALTFTEKKYSPKFIIDLATLTGAIIVGLGEEYAGLFSNDDVLSKQIYDSGNEVNEKVWRLPLHKNYNKLMDSSVADVQNINYSGGAGSITAAEFLQRFIIKKTPWSHLDIAGMAFSKKAANLNPGGATGFGIRLLNNLIKKDYE